MAGFHLGNVVGLLLTPIMLSSMGISGPFILFSSIGMLWLTTWAFKVSNDPRESRFISQSELRLIQAGKTDSPVKSNKFPTLWFLLSKLPTWAIIFANITNNWVSFLFIDCLDYYQLQKVVILGLNLLLKAVYIAGLLRSSLMDACLFQDCK